MNRVEHRAVPFLLAVVLCALLVVAAGCQKGGERLSYRCPMHPQVVADRPGDCSICGMRLVADASRAAEAGAPHMAETGASRAAETGASRTAEGGAPEVGALQAAEKGAPHTAEAGAPRAMKTGAAPQPAAVAASGYVCPMDPEVTSPTPARCSKCGMALVRRAAAPPAPDGVTAPPGLAPVTVSAAKREMLGVTTGVVERRRLTRHIRAAARIAADEGRLRRVTAPAEGWIDTLFVRGVGDAVRPGERLVEFYSVDSLAALRRDIFALARAKELGPVADTTTVTRGSLDPALQTYEFLRERIRRWGYSDEQIRGFVEKPATLDRLVMYAGTGGVISEKFVVPGQRVQAGDQLFTLVDLSRVWAEVDLQAADAPLIARGTPVELAVTSLPGRTFSGSVTVFAPSLDGQTRTQRVRVELANPDHALRPGLPAVATLVVDLGERLAVPAGAVLRSGEQVYAFRLGDGDRLLPVTVRTGTSDDGYVEILEGLAAGDRVVASATFLIDSESAMAAALRAAAER